MGQIARFLLGFLLWILIYPVLAHCQDLASPGALRVTEEAITTPSNQEGEAAPLTEAEERQIWQRLEELKLARQKIEILNERIQLERDKAAHEKDVATKEGELGRERIELLTGQRDLARNQAEEYKRAWEAATRRRGKGCLFKKIISIGIVRCQ